MVLDANVVKIVNVLLDAKVIVVQEVKKNALDVGQDANVVKTANVHLDAKVIVVLKKKKVKIVMDWFAFGENLQNKINNLILIII